MQNFIKPLSLGTLLVLSLTVGAGTVHAKSGSKTKESKGLDLNTIDKNASPAVDFYEYAVGKWLKDNPIPDAYGRWGTFEVLAESNFKILKKILESSAADKKALKGSSAQQIGDFYSAGMDTVKIEKEGAKAMEPYLKEIDAVGDLKGLFEEIARLHSYGVSALFDFGSGADAKNSSMVIGQLGQSGLGLPDRDYYLKDDSRSKAIRAKYPEHVEKMFQLLGYSQEDAKKASEVVMNIETELAKVSMDRVEMRDPNKTYNKVSVSGLIDMSPEVNWSLYFKTIGWENPQDMNVAQPEFFKGLSSIIKEHSINDWKTYLKWHFIRRAAGYLSSNFVEESFDFNGKFLNGLRAMQPRWKRVMFAINGLFGEALGQLYVKETFSPEAKDRAKKIVGNLLEAMGERIKNVDWMSSETKDQALKKLAAFNVKIGYPDKWKDYSALEVKRDSYLENVIRASKFEMKRQLDKIGKPVDRTEWEMTPQTVNAYYNPLQNEIVFPAAILQPPFYDVNADDAVNYGAMGAVIGHEITHGFDDEGRQFDAQGNIKEWWTKDDAAKFSDRAKLIVEQYNSYFPVDSMNINGALTQGENIADLGGLNVAFTAFKKTREFKDGKSIDGFTPVQRFFLSWAQVWKNGIRKETLMNALKTDPHSPGKYRVNGPLSNIPEFLQAFKIKPGETMYRPENVRVKIW
ncbi:MAG TPA: M13 family metallopeptidase [Ignavibacteriales bacterium]|nr:M13 family metallopeptidase [Ignavibacteriales bacterium]